MSKLGLLWRSVRHTRPRQLARRAALVVKRWVAEATASFRPRPTERTEPSSLPLAQPLPRALFPPRRHLLRFEGGRTFVRFLNQERPLEPGIDWKPQDLVASAQLWTMHLHYMEYLEGLDDAAFVGIVGDWIERNRPYAKGSFADVFGSYTASLRTVVWMQQLSARGASLPADFRAHMLGSLVQQLRLLERFLEQDLGGNHLLKNIKALLYAARFFTGPEALRWGALGARLLEQELAEQVLPDGVHFERSPSYHAQVFADLLETATVLPEGRLHAQLLARLPAMAQALADLAHPDGRVSLFNDGGLSAAYLPQECLDAYASLTGKSVAPRSSFALPVAGYFGARDAQGYVVADCGPVAPDHLPGHAHGDILSFEWSVLGRRIVVDAGVYAYTAGPLRAYARSTAAHNTLTVDEQDQCEFYGAFRMGRRARTEVHAYEPRGGGFVLEGSHDGFRRLAGGPIHHRRFEASPSRIEVQDRVLGGAGQPVRARLLLHPECRVTIVPGGARIERDGALALLESASPVHVQDAWFSPDLGVRLEAPQLVLEYGSAPCAGGFVLSRL